MEKSLGKGCDISLIMGTLGRSNEIHAFLVSLFAQHGSVRWKLIIVDQNLDDRVVEVLRNIGEAPAGCSILHLKASKKGLSRARNLGFRFAESPLVAFPDDDCVYGPGVLRFVIDRFSPSARRRHCDVITLHDTPDISKVDRIELLGEEVAINPFNIFRSAISYTIFARNSFGVLFDEDFGVGSEYGAAEETDFLLALLKENAILIKSGGPIVFHPNKDLGFVDLDRAYSYNRGIGAFFRKNISWRLPLLTLFFVISTLKIIIRLLQKKIQRDQAAWCWYRAILLGRVHGFASYKRR